MATKFIKKKKNVSSYLTLFNIFLIGKGVENKKWLFFDEQLFICESFWF